MIKTRHSASTKLRAVSPLQLRSEDHESLDTTRDHELVEWPVERGTRRKGNKAWIPRSSRRMTVYGISGPATERDLPLFPLQRGTRVCSGRGDYRISAWSDRGSNPTGCCVGPFRERALHNIKQADVIYPDNP
jgi:hypothetical protein